MTAQAVLMGLGVTGRAVADALMRRGHEIIAFDDRPSDEVLEWASERGIDVQASSPERLAAALDGADWAIPAPGLGDQHIFFAQAAAANVTIISEFDLAQMWDDRPAVAVTGTDGKTTVVTLIERMLNADAITAAAVGNTDTPWVTAIDDSPTQVFVVEASSFRLAHSNSFSPAVAAWLNFGPDHLDTHRDLDTYARAKASIWSHLNPQALVLANRDDKIVAGFAEKVTTGRVETWGLDADGTHGLDGDTLIVAGQPLIERGELTRSLPHDVSNAIVSAACALEMGASRAACAQVLRDFTGLRHRVEFIVEHQGVRWVNDSKATTPHATAAGLAGFDSVILLAGGRNKGLAFDDMTAQADRIRHVVALGEAAADIEAVFGDLVPTTTASSMSMAIELAHQVAERGDVVLLSPACASFDWYRNYKARGDDFCRLVRERFGSAAPAHTDSTSASPSPASEMTR